MSIYKYNFIPINYNDTVDSDKFNNIFKSQEDEYKQLYNYIYSLYGDVNQLFLLMEMGLDIFSDIYKELNSNIVLIPRNIEQKLLTESETLKNALIDNITGYITCNKINSKVYNTNEYYSIVYNSNNFTYLTKPTSTFINDGQINTAKPIISVLKFDKNTSSITANLNVQLTKLVNTSLINTIKIKTIPSGYNNYLFNINYSKNNTNLTLTASNEPLNLKTQTFNISDYSQPLYLNINEIDVDIMNIDIRTKKYTSTDNEYISIIGLKNIVFEHNIYATNSYFIFNIKDNIDISKYSKISRISCAELYYHPLKTYEIQISIYESLEAFNNGSGTPQYTYTGTTLSIPAPYYTITNDSIIVIKLSTDNNLHTPIIKYIEIKPEL